MSLTHRTPVRGEATAALDRAAGVGRPLPPRIPDDRLLPNPLSPRRSFDSGALILGAIKRRARRGVCKGAAMAGQTSPALEIQP